MSKNKNARIVSVVNENAQRGGFTYTARRDPGTLQARVNTNSGGTTELSVGRDGFVVNFDGREARTLYSLLSKHYENVGLSTER